MTTEFSEPFAFYENMDILLRCKSQDIADRYVDKVLGYATTVEKQKILRAFIPTIPLVRRRGNKKTGGNMLVHDPHDICVSKLIAAADTFHDFHDAPLMPGTELPREIAMSTLHNERAFAKAMSARKTLRFAKEVTNPCYGRDLTIGFDIVGVAAKYPTESIEKLYTRQQSQVHGHLGNHALCAPVDIWTMVDDSEDSEVNKRREVVKLHQVAQLVGIMLSKFGSKSSLTIDASGNMLIALIIGVQYVAKAFTRRFSTRPFITSLADLPKKWKDVLDDLHIPEPDWNVSIADANIFDPADNALRLPVDPNPTGAIYRKEYGYQVELGGMASSDRRVPVTITNHSGQVFTANVSNKESVATLSKNSIQQFINSRRSTPATTTNLYNLLASIQTDTELLYALKRAGDWGQVEHCAKYGKVFVTADRLAALYAIYRNVQCMYFTQGQCMNDEIPHLPGFFRYTFIL
jgi:hypothetical protein